MFLDATVAQLYMSEMNKPMRNDIDYTSGNVTTNLVAKRINTFSELVAILPKIDLNWLQRMENENVTK